MKITLEQPSITSTLSYQSRCVRRDKKITKHFSRVKLPRSLHYIITKSHSKNQGTLTVPTFFIFESIHASVLRFSSDPWQTMVLIRTHIRDLQSLHISKIQLGGCTFFLGGRTVVSAKPSFHIQKTSLSHTKLVSIENQIFNLISNPSRF